MGEQGGGLVREVWNYNGGHDTSREERVLLRSTKMIGVEVG